MVEGKNETIFGLLVKNANKLSVGRAGRFEIESTELVSGRLELTRLLRLRDD